MTQPVQTDIATYDDVRTIVHAFYDGMETHPSLGIYFTGLNWTEHLPTMVGFWSSIVFQTGEYRGRPFDPHARMPGLGREHFADWIGRFRRTVDAHFAGDRAELMKNRAEQIAAIFQSKLGLFPLPGTDTPDAEVVP